MNKLINNLLEMIDAREDLDEVRKGMVKHYLTDEDFANERFAIIDLVEMILINPSREAL